jgi:hypothetical protein
MLVEIAGLFKLRQEAVPAYLRSPFYWCLTVAMVLAGGTVGWLHLQSGNDMQALLAVNIGASAPLIISSLVSPPKAQ